MNIKMAKKVIKEFIMYIFNEMQPPRSDLSDVLRQKMTLLILKNMYEKQVSVF